MPRKESEVVSEVNGPVHHQEELGSGQPTLANIYRPSEQSLDRQQLKLMKSHFEQQEKKSDKLMEMTRRLEQYLASLEQDARESRLATEEDGHADTKTRERTEGAATAVQAMQGDPCSPNRVDPDTMCSTSFDDDCTGSPVLPCLRKDALVHNGGAAPKSCLSLLEMRTISAGDGLLLTSKTSTATKTLLLHSSLVLPDRRDVF